MRVTLSNKKDKVLRFIYILLESNLNDNEVKTVVNGEEFRGVASDFMLDDTDLNFIRFNVGETEIKIPFNDDSIANINGNLYYIETESHTTLIDLRLPK